MTDCLSRISILGYVCIFKCVYLILLITFWNKCFKNDYFFLLHYICIFEHNKYLFENYYINVFI